MVENGFEAYDETSQVSYEVATSNVVKLSAAVMTIGSILSGQQVCQAAIVAINGAFNSMVATLKAFFVPTSVKAVIVTAAILVLATVVIVNWNKIKPVFNQIVNVFVDNAKKLADTIRNVFNYIKSLTGANVIEKISSYSGSTAIYEKITTKCNVDEKVVENIKTGTLSKAMSNYYFAYISGTSLQIVKSYPLNYVEALSVCYITGLFNNKSSSELETTFNLVTNYNELSQTAKDLINYLSKVGRINSNLVGVYSSDIIDAGKLAVSCKATVIDTVEIHGSMGSGYYWHFHSKNHSIHIGYGNAY